jgi:hypothetical protein
VPTPHGNISATFALSSGSALEAASAAKFTAVTAKVVVPQGTKGRLGLPKLGLIGTVATVRLNGQMQKVASQDADYVYLVLAPPSSQAQSADENDISSGASVFTAELDFATSANTSSSNSHSSSSSGGGGGGGGSSSELSKALGGNQPHASTFHPNALPFNYSGKFVGFDTTTVGDWVGKYGTVGYHLFRWVFLL